MTAHELAKHLLEQPDYPVFINGWGSDEGQDCEVVGSIVFDGKVMTSNGEEHRRRISLEHEEVKW